MRVSKLLNLMLTRSKYFCDNHKLAHGECSLRLCIETYGFNKYSINSIRDSFFLEFLGRMFRYDSLPKGLQSLITSGLGNFYSELFRINWRCLYLCLLVTFVISADSILVYNKTFRDLYVGIYYRYPKIPFMDQKPGVLSSPIQCVDAQSFGVISRPDRIYGADRQLVFVEDKSLLEETLWPQELDELHALFVGNWQGNSFYIATDDEGDHHGYTALQWNAIQQPIQYAQDTILNMLPAVSKNPYKNQVAYVRDGNNLCESELDYLKKRAVFIKNKLEEKNYSVPEKVSTISVVCSGGGYRAMLYSLGALKGLEQAGILDLVTYLVGLSGSTWAIGTWLSSGLSLEAFHEWLINHIGYQLNELDDEDFTLMGEVLLTKYCVGQPVGFVDLYGAFIANDLFDSFSDEKMMVHLSDQAQVVNSGAVPFPIYTAISGQDTQAERLWYEFTPYEVGAPWLNAYVPTWAFGRKFKKGVSVSNAPEQSLGTLFGTFGLAVGITVERMFSETNIHEKMSSSLLKVIIKKILTHYGDKRPISAEYCNMVFDMNDHIFNDLKIIDLVDAGINCNLPYVPISGMRQERTSNIIIFIDASAGAIGQELKKVEAYARAHHLLFPVIDYSLINKHAISVFKDEYDPTMPVVIYIPRIVDEQLLALHCDDMPELYNCLHHFDIETCIANESCNTFNFSYTPEQARKLTALGEFNALMCKEVVMQNLCVR